MINRLCPNYRNQLVPDLVQTRTQYSLRNSNNMSTIRTNTELYYNSFLPSTVRAWNNLSNKIRTSTSLNEFKRKLSENVNKPPKYYYYGNRVAQIHHSRLRLECSALKQHLHKKQLVDSPLCTCIIPETSKHFLFDCWCFILAVVLSIYVIYPVIPPCIPRTLTAQTDATSHHM